MNFKFPYGTNEPYFSKKEPEEASREKALGLSKLFGSTVALGALGFANNPLGPGNIHDVYYKTLRVMGHAFPMGLFASLRLPEIISPFTSTHFKSGGLSNSQVLFDSNFLGHSHTLQYLSNVSGLSPSTLRSHGVGLGGILRWQQDIGIDGNLGQGKLFVDYNNKSQLIAQNILLQERSHAVGDVFSPRSSANQYAEGMSSVINPNLNPNVLFSTVDAQTGKVTGSHRWMPIPGPVGDISSSENIIRRTTLPRGFLAFKAQRLNNAIKTISDNVPIFGEILEPLLEKTGIILENKPALKMYASYAGLGSKIGAMGLSIGYYNWWMRYQADDNFLKKEMGYAASSTALASTIGWIGRSYKGPKGASLLKQISSINPKTAAFVGLSAFMTQNLLPGFDKGVYAGVSKTLSQASIFSAQLGENTGLSAYRQKLDELMPGITGTNVSIFTGLLGYAATEMLLPGENRYKKFYKHLKTDLNGLNFRDTLSKWIFTPKRLDNIYHSWEKVSYNLPYGVDINAYKALVASGSAPRPTIPFQVENENFANTLKKLPGSTSFATKLEMIADHLMQDKHARYKNLSAGAAAFAIGFTAHKILTTGIVGSLKSSDDLKKEQSGEKLVAVRKGRWWGAGGTPWDGSKVSYYRPSLSKIIESDAVNKNIWGEEDVEKYSPIHRWFLKNFSYYLEDKNYYNRPYPVTTPAFSSIPVAGDFLAATIGKLIKPERYQFTDTWMKQENGEESYLSVPSWKDSNPNLKLGGTGIGKPLSPSSVEFMYSQTQYKLRELQGLFGFFQNTIEKGFTGSETYIPNVPILAASGDQDSTNKMYWDLELGGLFGSTEIVRRFLPKDRLETRNRYNPIINQMPSWIPEDYKTGDPYTKLPLGDVRLPGAGYEALYPELKGINPENYPIWHKYHILGNIAPYSEEFKELKMKVGKMKKDPTLKQEIRSLIEETDRNIEAQRLKRNYYVPSEKNLDDSPTEMFIRSSYFSILDTVKRIAAPAEYLVFGGFRPFQKFLPPGTALQDYENYKIYGSETSFWTPEAAWRDYIGPSLASSLRLLGVNIVPPQVEEKRQIDNYFDQLSYYKYMNLAMEAKRNGNIKEAKDFEKQARKTVTGVNPYGHPLSVYAALPQTEKEYYDAFRNASDEERSRLLEILPENQKEIFAVLWSKQDKVAQKYKKFRTDDSLRSLYEVSDLKKYLSYEDFVTYTKTENELSNSGLPADDWVGWRKEVDPTDVKLKWLESKGYDIHNFNLWESQQKMLARKPYLEGVEDAINVPLNNSLTSSFKQLFNKFKSDNNYTNYIINKNNNSYLNGKAVVIVNDNREDEIKKLYREYDEK